MRIVRRANLRRDVVPVWNAAVSLPSENLDILILATASVPFEMLMAFYTPYSDLPRSGMDV